MVTILKPPRHPHSDAHIDIASEEPGNTGSPGRSSNKGSDKQGRDGIELGEEESSEGSGTASAPGEGPNPTA